jgi:hypothetical protein
MAHFVGRLTALKVARVKRPGMYADRAGLYLQVTGNGETSIAKSWIFRFTLRGRSREMGAARTQAALDAASSLTFKECAAQYIDAHRASWRNAKHAAQWSATIKTYAEPIVGLAPIQPVDTTLVMKIVEPLWSTRPSDPTQELAAIYQCQAEASISTPSFLSSPVPSRKHALRS